MPNDNIERAVAKGTGGGEGITLEEVTYEGYVLDYENLDTPSWLFLHIRGLI